MVMSELYLVEQISLSHVERNLLRWVNTTNRIVVTLCITVHSAPYLTYLQYGGRQNHLIPGSPQQVTVSWLETASSQKVKLV